MDAIKIKENQYYSTEDIFALPDGKRAEIIDGRWFDMAPPSPNHQRIVGLLFRKISDYLDSKGGQCEVFPAPFAVFLNADDRNYVEPDLSVVCDPDRIDERGLKGAPDLVVEVVSPSSKRMDYYIKLFKYRTAGVREYWIVNPETRVSNIFCFNNDVEKVDQVRFEDPLGSYIYPDLAIRIADDFEKKEGAGS